jgi:hypothetical protein
VRYKDTTYHVLSTYLYLVLACASSVLALRAERHPNGNAGMWQVDSSTKCYSHAKSARRNENAEQRNGTQQHRATVYRPRLIDSIDDSHRRHRLVDSRLRRGLYTVWCMRLSSCGIRYVWGCVLLVCSVVPNATVLECQTLQYSIALYTIQYHCCWVHSRVIHGLRSYIYGGLRSSTLST